ncbi:SOS response-associated peptidase family protein [Pantoea osteomyelitidis]|uniref:Abasic site processing protein n=1 Tax=Pantoea osteomyelitidis TaxID=3230026 RepID=A0ABW7PWY5_9GAMM
MCGRFAQYQPREAYLNPLKGEDNDIPYDPMPIERFNVAPGTKVLLLNQRDGSLHLDPVLWGYAPEWWDKAPLINARSETAASGRMFKPLWNHGRAIVPADGWFEWKRAADKKQPYFIHAGNDAPLYFAAIGKAPYDRPHEKEGFVIVTAASDKGMVDIHDRRPLVLTAEAALAWMSEETSPTRAAEIAHDGAVKEDEFIWHPVTIKVGSVKNQSKDLIEEIDNPIV